MKYNKIILSVALGTLSFFSVEVTAQYRNDMSKAETAKRDSLEIVSQNEIRAQDTRDETRMADAKLDRKQSKAKAKDAQRIERDASDAAQESKYAVRTEKKAQKSRKKADKQAEKAAKARDKSDSN